MRFLMIESFKPIVLIFLTIKLSKIYSHSLNSFMLDLYNET